MTELARQLWEARRSGAVIHADDFAHPESSQEAYAIQHEIAALSGQAARGFKVGSTSLDEVADAVAAVAGAIEVVGTRFSGGLTGKGRWLVTADCGANIAFVSGRWRQDSRPLDLKAHPVAMTINGTLRGSGTGDRALGDPLNVLLWLANQQSAVGRGLKSGEIVSTGTCTGLDPVRPGDRVQAEFGDLGSVEIAFE